MNELQILEHNEVRVMTTEQLADAYGCDSRNISDNFKNNEGRFLEGKHYFRLEGKELKTFKRYSENIGLPVNKFSPVIYLWTKCKAAKPSSRNGYEVGSEYDAKYGTVNTYHTDILEMIFGGYENEIYPA